MGRSFFKFLERHALYFAWLISLIGVCWSLFYGEILGNSPCPLCWYQRIALFPLVILLGMAAYKREAFIIPYVLPIVFLGGCVALFHVLQPLIPLLQQVKVCRWGVPCSQGKFAFIFPSISALGFFLIALFLLIERKNSQRK
jgi:disulfide bond formation protein DsbB